MHAEGNHVEDQTIEETNDGDKKSQQRLKGKQTRNRQVKMNGDSKNSTTKKDIAQDHKNREPSTIRHSRTSRKHHNGNNKREEQETQDIDHKPGELEKLLEDFIDLMEILEGAQNERRRSGNQETTSKNTQSMEKGTP